MRTKFKKFSDSDSAGARWSEYAAELFGDWQIVWEHAVLDYQGSAEFLAFKDGRFAYLTWSYGSCSGCDGWEDMPEEDVRAEFKNMAEYFDDYQSLKNFAERVNYGNGFKEAVADFLFIAQLEEELSK